MHGEVSAARLGLLADLSAPPWGCCVVRDCSTGSADRLFGSIEESNMRPMHRDGGREHKVERQRIFQGPGLVPSDVRPNDRFWIRAAPCGAREKMVIGSVSQRVLSSLCMPHFRLNISCVIHPSVHSGAHMRC